VFEGFSRAQYYVGEFGMGTKMKFVANLLVTIHNVAAAEAFVLGMKAGLDPEMIHKAVKDGGGTSRMFEVRGPLMVAGKYDEPTMKVDLHQKDIKIISAFAEKLQCPTPLLAASAQVYTSALAKGWAKQDTAPSVPFWRRWQGSSGTKRFEPQNIEQEMVNIEGRISSIFGFLFDIR
ncbi:MAG: NAD-binding protein, partial [Pseudomonadota bacterium]